LSPGEAWCFAVIGRAAEAIPTAITRPAGKSRLIASRSSLAALWYVSSTIHAEVAASSPLASRVFATGAAMPNDSRAAAVSKFQISLARPHEPSAGDGDTANGLSGGFGIIRPL